MTIREMTPLVELTDLERKTRLDLCGTEEFADLRFLRCLLKPVTFKFFWLLNPLSKKNFELNSTYIIKPI